MKIRRASSISNLWLTAGILIATGHSALRGETTGEAYLRISQGISGLTFSDFLYQRRGSFYFESNPDLKASFEHLDQAMAIETTLAELSELAKHPEPKVRTLALMRLYNMEEPAALRVIYSRTGDMAETFPSRSFLTQDHESDRMLLDTKTITIGSLASLMLKQADFPLRWLGDPATGGSINEWIGWYEYLYFRATGGSSPIPKDRVPKMAAVRRKIDALPPVTRAWMLLAIGSIDLHINDDAAPERHIPLFATEEELIAAAKQLGPDALLAFLRDGTRTGLRDPKSDDAAKGRGFILAHAGKLFRRQDAEALKSMGLIVAAADANPGMASQWIREELELMDQSKTTYGRGAAIAALVDLCGDREADFVVNWFYGDHEKFHDSNAQSEFIRELKRRKPKEWKKTIHGIVEHAGFERLNRFVLVNLAMLGSSLGGVEIPVSAPRLGTFDLPRIRNNMRAHFGLPLMTYRPLQERIESVKPPVLTVKLPVAAEFIELSPDGSILAAVPREGHLQLFSTTDGKPLGTLTTEGEIRTVHFGRSNEQLLTLNRERLLQTWDVATAKEISRTLSETFATYYDAIFSSSGEFLVTSPHQGYAVMDLASGKPRWKIEMRTCGNGMFRLSPDDRRLAINDGFGKTIQFFDITTAKPFATLEGHADVPLGAAFSPDGNVFVSWANDSEIMVWNGKTGAFLDKFTRPSGLIPWLVFTTDSKHMLCSTEQRLIALFDLKTGIAVRAFSHSKEFGGLDRFRPRALRVSTDGKALIGLTDVFTHKHDQFDTYLERWDLPP